jgi:hypothetical protein
VFFKRKIRKSAATLCPYGFGKDVWIGERAELVKRSVQ